MRPLLSRPGLVVLIACGFLLLLFSLIFSPAAVRSNSAPPPPPPTLDARWITLIRSAAVESQTHRSTTALPTLNLQLTDNLVAGRAFSAGSITIELWRGNTCLIKTMIAPYLSGLEYFYVLQFGNYYATVQPGDVILLTQGTASFTMTVPALTAQADAYIDQVFGTAPVSQSVTAYLYSVATDTGPYLQTVGVDASGYYTADYSSTLDVRPRDSGYVAYSEAPGRTTYVRCVAPFLRAQAGAVEISGMAAPLDWIMLTVVHPSGEPYGYAFASSTADGSFDSVYHYGSWSNSLQPGDRISAMSGGGQLFSMVVLTLTAQIDLDNGVIQGDAPGDETVEVLRFNGPLCCSSNTFWRDAPTELAVVTATVDGQYSAAQALASPNYGAAIITGPDGNQTYARFVVPHLSARMGRVRGSDPALTGQINAASVPITVAIQGPSGYLKNLRTFMSAPDGYFDDYYGSSLILDTGDVITVASDSHVQIAIQLPVLTGQIDPLTDRIAGTAPPGAHLKLTVNTYNINSYPPPPLATPTPAPPPAIGISPAVIALNITATAQGEYQVDLSSMADLNNDTSGEVTLITAEGYTVIRSLTLSRRQDCDYRPSEVEVGGNRVVFWTVAIGCQSANSGMVRLRDAAGNLKSQQILPIWSYGYNMVYFYAGARPVRIMPGDRIEVEWSTEPGIAPTSTPYPTPPPAPTAAPASLSVLNDRLITVNVPTVTIQLDAVANIISGQAPATGTVALDIVREYEYHSYTATVNAQGFYTRALSPDFELAAGDTATVRYLPIERPTFTAFGVVPLIHADLYQSYVSGLLPPFTLYTGTLRTASGVTKSYSETSSSDGRFYLDLVPIRPGDLLTVTTAQQILHLAVPALTAHVDRASATVFGQAPPFARIRVMPYDDYYAYWTETTADASGAYSVTFPGNAPLNSTYGSLTYYDTTGNQVGLVFATVHWDVVIGGNCLNGIVDMVGAPLTLTLRGSNSMLKSIQVFTPTSPHYNACFTTTVQSGDQITLYSAAASEAFSVPVLTARHNYTRQAVEGSAPPFGEVLADLKMLYAGNPAAYYPVTRRVFADETGQYGVDTSDLQLPLLVDERVYVHDAVGNTTSHYFTVTGYQTFLPVIRR
jgi:hypothetical protein